MSPGRSSPIRSGPAPSCGCSAVRGTRPRWGAAFAEYGRNDKTMHLLALADPVDDTYRRLRTAAHRPGVPPLSPPRDLPRRPGPVRQAYREDQEDRLASLGPVLNTVALRNTRSLDAVVAQLRAEGHDIKDEAVARLSPLEDRHIDFLDRCLFNIKAGGPGQGLRSFRAPETVEDED
ncbi:Tn3 family transposase [Streptomyces fungicidicus]